MIALFRVLLMIALAVVTVAPSHAHAAMAAAHHAAPSGHAHQHGTEQHEDSGHEHEHSGSISCCSSLSVQCCSAALAYGSQWTPAERRPADIRNWNERRASSAGAVLEFEPPPPRA